MLAPYEQTWPDRMWLVRHGESAGNVARDAAELAGEGLIEIASRDVDVPLSPLGEQQARALGAWFAARPEEQRPTVLLTSPYLRAVQTASLWVDAAGLSTGPLVTTVDERLREKELGSLNRLTKAGVLAKFPREAELREQIGKFYYRPPGGESWCDVILRLRSVLDHIQLQYRRERVMVIAHQVVVLCFRYLLENMNEAQLLAIDREKDVANCALTEYNFARDGEGRGKLNLSFYNDVTPLQVDGTKVTVAVDPPVAPR